MARDYILVVDDDPGMRLVLTDVLEEEGFIVRSAVDGVDALRFCEMQLPMLLITDLAMPRLSGEGLIRELEARRLGSFPIIITSAGDEMAKRVAGYVAHREPKPLDLDRLVAQVRMLVEAQRTFEEAGSRGPARCEG